MLKAVIFDMDGVLINTEPLYDHHKTKYLKEKFNIEYDKKYHERTRGLSAKAFWEIILTDFNLTHSIDEVVKDSRQAYFEFLQTQDLKAIDGVIELIEKLSTAKISLAVASSASLRRIKMILEALKISDKFKIIVCGDDVKKGKPYPDIYLKAAEKLGVEPKDCMAIEDATNGVKSAKSAGMKVIAFKDPIHNNQDLSEADLIIKSFSEINISTLKNL